MGSDCSWVGGFLWEVRKLEIFWNWTVVMAAQLCEQTKGHLIVKREKQKYTILHLMFCINIKIYYTFHGIYM